MARKGLGAEAILRAAMELIEEKGYDSFSLRELAARLGVKPASLYNYVKGVDEISASVAMEAAERLNRALAEAIQGKSADEAFLSAALAYRRYADENPEIYKALMQMPSSEDEKIRAASWKSFEPMRELIRGYRGGGEETIHYVRALRAAMHGFVSLTSAGFMRHFAPPVEESYLAMIRGYLRNLKNMPGEKQHAHP